MYKVLMRKTAIHNIHMAVTFAETNVKNTTAVSASNLRSANKLSEGQK